MTYPAKCIKEDGGHICEWCMRPDLEDDGDPEIYTDSCRFEGLAKQVSCPEFICGEQNRYCDSKCEFLGGKE